LGKEGGEKVQVIECGKTHVLIKIGVLISTICFNLMADITFSHSHITNLFSLNMSSIISFKS